MTFSSGEIQFTRHEYPYLGHLDSDLSYEGAFAITRDNVHKTFIHKAYSFLQSLLNRCCDIGIKTDYNHGMLVLDRDEDDLTIAHITGEGLKTKRVNYLNYSGNDVTSLVVYIPTDEKLRTLITKYGLQTVGPGNVKISLWKIATHWMKKPELKVSPHIRVAYAVADLLMGNQLLNREGTDPEPYYCMDYALTVLQSAILIRGIEEEEPLNQFVGTLTRDKLSMKIHQKLTKQGEFLHTLLIKNPIMQVDAYTAVSGFVAKQMDKQIRK